MNKKNNNISSLRDLKNFAGKTSNNMSFDDLMNEFQTLNLDKYHYSKIEYYYLMKDNEVKIDNFVTELIKSTSVEKNVFSIWDSRGPKSKSKIIISILEKLLFIIIANRIKKELNFAVSLKEEASLSDKYARLNAGILVSDLNNDKTSIDWEKLKIDLKEILWLTNVLFNLFNKKNLNTNEEVSYEKTVNKALVNHIKQNVEQDHRGKINEEILLEITQVLNKLQYSIAIKFKRKGYYKEIGVELSPIYKKFKSHFGDRRIFIKDYYELIRTQLRLSKEELKIGSFEKYI